MIGLVVNQPPEAPDVARAADRVLDSPFTAVENRLTIMDAVAGVASSTAVISDKRPSIGSGSCGLAEERCSLALLTRYSPCPQA